MATAARASTTAGPAPAAVVTEASLLAVWDESAPLPPAGRALALLTLAAENPPDAFGHWPVGRRDNALLALRAHLFGSRVTGLADCPACGEAHELSFGVDDVRVTAPDAPETLAVDVEGVEVRFRLPVAGDLAVLDPALPEREAARELLRHCIIAVRRHAEPGDPSAADDELPPAVVDAIQQTMAWFDPQADIELALSCQRCGAAWAAPFDIGAFLWSEVNAWALRLLTDVTALASAFGWSENEVLAVSPRRRRMYLELAAR